MSERGDKLMNRLSDWFGQEISGNASKTAADIVRAQKDGVGAYSIGGIILSGCGIGWILLSFIPIICKNPLSDWGWMPILSAIHIVLGIVLVFLSKKSKGFQEWANKNFRKSLKEQEKLRKKVQIGKVTLPITYGDTLALKVLGVIAIILIVILGIGCLQGWLEWQS